MLQYTPLCSRELLGHGATVAQQTLDLFILVRVRMPQPELRCLVRLCTKKSLSFLDLVKIQKNLSGLESFNENMDRY
jgi:hypothetical protein